jgi:hypothetical protein
MDNIQLGINLEIFPLPIVESALYVLGDRMDGRIDEAADGQLVVSLTAIEESLDAAGMERAFHRALIAASVNESAFQAVAPIRNYLAQTAFSITTESQQTIEEFVASLAGNQTEEQAGAPSTHLDSLPENDERFTPTEAGNRWLQNEENGEIALWLDTRQYLLPDALWAAHETQEACPCIVNNLPRGQLVITLNPTQDGLEPTALVAQFEHWLALAKERRPKKR